MKNAFPPTLGAIEQPYSAAVNNGYPVNIRCRLDTYQFLV